MTELVSQLLQIIVAMAFSLVGMAYEPEAADAPETTETAFAPAMWTGDASVDFVFAQEILSTSVNSSGECGATIKADSELPVFIGIQS